MKRHKQLVTMIASGVLLLGCLSAFADQDKPEFDDPRTQALFEASKPMTGDHLWVVFTNHTWKWQAGGGFFAARKQAFTAWSREGGNPSVGDGRWFTLTSKGSLCFRATWRAMDGSAPAVTCFRHRIVGNTIFQKRDPDGEWYVFKHAKRTYGDEFLKLLKGDHVYYPKKRVEAELGR
ncbi:DUF995 domain-containing protein [uncultured Cohaesibacter sp.]|uniref:DUF995 domain-containing protein n=1 Tax=uncultured Cohaesibacter sp. TaxID=1002546 RepID=UPI0029C8DB57|nr:DUF995 domain-containing protein [uncultured Cohaesibacter sp.]